MCTELPVQGRACDIPAIIGFYHPHPSSSNRNAPSIIVISRSCSLGFLSCEMGVVGLPSVSSVHSGSGEYRKGPSDRMLAGLALAAGLTLCPCLQA